jgi:hypothetical protein
MRVQSARMEVQSARVHIQSAPVQVQSAPKFGVWHPVLPGPTAALRWVSGTLMRKSGTDAGFPPYLIICAGCIKTP